MKENDKIKELFKERFESFEAPVDPKIWSGIESSLGNAAPATGVSILSTKAIIGLVVGATAVATIGAVTYMNAQNEVSNRVEVSVPSGTSESTSSKFISEVQLDESQVLVETVQPKINENSETNAIKDVKASVEVEKTPTESINMESSIVSNNETQESNLEESMSTSTPSENEFTKSTVTTEVVSQAPATIDVAEQSRAQAYPAGGVAPITVSFSSVGEVDEIKWKFDDGTESSELNPDHEFENPGIYFVTMLAKLKDGSVVMDKAVVEVKEAVSSKENLELETSSIGTIGNYFTPNGDGENDEFVVEVKGVQSYSISIYAVNGQLVYTSSDPNKGWDGNDLSGNRVVDGTYYYMINAIGEDQKVYSPKGYLTVTGGF